MASKRLQVIKGHLKTSPLASTDGEGPLTKEQLDQYDRDGFFVISGLYDVKDLEVYRKRFQEICIAVQEHTIISAGLKGCLLYTSDAADE